MSCLVDFSATPCLGLLLGNGGMLCSSVSVVVTTLSGVSDAVCCLWCMEYRMRCLWLVVYRIVCRLLRVDRGITSYCSVSRC